MCSTKVTSFELTLSAPMLTKVDNEGAVVSCMCWQSSTVHALYTQHQANTNRHLFSIESYDGWSYTSLSPTTISSL